MLLITPKIKKIVSAEREFFIMKRDSDKSVSCNDLEVREVKNFYSRHIYLKLFLKNFEKSNRQYFIYLINSLFRSQTYSYLVYVNKKPVGIFTVAIEEEDGLPHIYDFSVLKEYRNKGIASKMMDWICEEFEEWDSVLLNVECSNERARSLYESKGFEIIGYLISDFT